MKIGSKREFYRLWRAGLLGNRPRCWDTVSALAFALKIGKLDPVTPIVVRSDVIPGWRTRYDVPAIDALALGTETFGLTFNEALDESRILLQGEVQRGYRGLELTCSFRPKKMKVALHEWPFYFTGLVAKLVLDRYLAPSSRDDLEAIWDLYPDAVIEFGVYDYNLGDQPHRNTLIWEVRNY